MSATSYAKGIERLEDFRARVSASPQASLPRSSFDVATWRGVNPALDVWHDLMDEVIARGSAKPDEAATARMIDQLERILHDDVVFHPPTYWKARRGKPLAMWILQQVGDIIGSNFRYHRQIVDATGTSVVLEFSAMVDHLPVQGIDLITFDSCDRDAKLVDFKVMIRPPEAALKLKEHMDRRVRALRGGARPKL